MMKLKNTESLSFSLCNLAVTCLYFREICCTLLDTQGCVSLQWERVKESSDKYRWQIAYKVIFKPLVAASNVLSSKSSKQGQISFQFCFYEICNFLPAMVF